MLTRMAEAQTKGDGVPQFGQRHRMALALEFAGLSRDDMAAELDVHRNTIGNWMKGTKPAPRAALIAWALRCGVPFEWLLTGTITDNGPDDGTEQDIRQGKCIGSIAAQRERRQTRQGLARAS